MKQKTIDLSDHDLLIEISTHVKYIRDSLECHQKQINFLRTENQVRKDWQEEWQVKIKTFAGIAAFIGGVVVFISDRLWDFFSKKI